MNGMRLAGTPCGSSPIDPEGWAPTGFKYLKTIAFQRSSD